MESNMKRVEYHCEIISIRSPRKTSATRQPEKIVRLIVLVGFVKSSEKYNNISIIEANNG